MVRAGTRLLNDPERRAILPVCFFQAAARLHVMTSCVPLLTVSEEPLLGPYRSVFDLTRKMSAPLTLSLFRPQSSRPLPSSHRRPGMICDVVVFGNLVRAASVFIGSLDSWSGVYSL